MRTLIVCPTARDAVLAKLREIIGPAQGFSEPVAALYDGAEQQNLQTHAELIVVSLVGDPSRGHEVIHRFRETTDARILAAGPVADPKLILRTLQVGADVFLDKDELESEFTAALNRLFPKPGAGLSCGRLCAVMPVNGGCGASTLAVNLAALFARQHGKCGLIDLNPGRGDLPALLDLKPQFSLADLCQNEARLDRGMLEKMLARHDSGIHLLASPREFADIRSLTVSGVKQALSLTRALFSQTVVDVEDCIHAEQVEVLRQAQEILLVCRLDFTSLRNTRRLLDYLQRLEIPRNHIRVIVNQRGQPNELIVEEAEKAIGEKLTSFIPYDPITINLANNTGMPAALQSPDAKVVHAIEQLITPWSDKRPEHSGFLKRFKLFVWGDSLDRAESTALKNPAEVSQTERRLAFEQ